MSIIMEYNFNEIDIFNEYLKINILIFAII